MMVAARKIRCVVVLADAETLGMPQRTQPRFRPSDLLPWADPHIRSLVEQLQQEVREEEAQRRMAPPAPSATFDDDSTLDDELALDLITRRF
ncbi:hypothetical protein [Botrimarina mediterranea]|uniref:Uncharacterized protein n=1 Tax=Botrimarina mediterranea TaxID=2528022 RepID=A0A518KEV9_9BACT|nr:hypothetical protein [Botrimarina mediterranea]QDV76331.1 hypothetical protein Spa11_45610 [Botrimarina mediterranea]QDV80929.1 hypothetical protein K2D_45640 [Planctomycetes bacterium K2D]